jgi:hypothetical protein
MTSLPGCARSQSASVPASRSGSRSTGRPVSTSIKIVPQARPRRNAKSSTPSTRAVPACGAGSAISSRSMHVRPAVIPSAAASRDPARPASAAATAPSIPASGGVRRAYREVRPSTCSANVVRLHPGAAQKNRRAVSRITTRRPPIPASASRLP